jgi:undecaprenyl-diphosphatase
MINSLIEKDIELLIYLNNLGTQQWDSFWLIVTNKFSAIPLYILLLYFTYKQVGLKKTVIVVIFVLLLIAITDQTSNLFKYGFQRLRPCHNQDISNLIRLVGKRCGGLYSYFSAHAANSMAIAVFFGMLLKAYATYFRILLIIWALLVAYSRVYIGVHFPLDVITGIIFGILYGTIFYKLVILFIRKFMN